MKLSIKQLRNIFWAFISLIWISIILKSKTDTGIDWTNMVRETGEWSWRLLIFTVYIGILRKIFSHSLIRKLATLRKHTGIFAFLIATSHFIFEFIKRYLYKDYNIANFIQASFSTDHAMIFGTLAWLIMLPAFLTSTNWAILKMGARKWKFAQRLIHITFVLAGLHFALIKYFVYENGKINIEPIIFLSIYTLAYLILFIYKKRKKNV